MNIPRTRITQKQYTTLEIAVMVSHPAALSKPLMDAFRPYGINLLSQIDDGHIIVTAKTEYKSFYSRAHYDDYLMGIRSIIRQTVEKIEAEKNISIYVSNITVSVKNCSILSTIS
jgi:hypothetical protein